MPKFGRPFLVMSSILGASILITIVATGLVVGNISSRQYRQDISGIQSVLDPFMQQYPALIDTYRSQYTSLNSSYTSLQTKLDTTQTALSAALSSSSASQAQLASTQSDNQQLLAQVIALQASLKDTTDQNVSYRQESLRIQAAIVAGQDDYRVLYGKLSAVNSRQSDSINSFTATERTAFYLMWDKWWQAVIIGTD